MKVQISLPSKTFLLGEYLALVGGPSLIVNTKPRFEFNVLSGGEGSCAGVNPNSPAGKYLRAHNQYFQNMQSYFTDPHEGAGGFGASSAQFLFVYFWKQMAEGGNPQQLAQNFEEKVWQEYKKYSHDGGGRAPSGADVLAQFKGQISYFHRDPWTLNSFRWPFSDKSFVILRTGNKVATHKHLQEKFEIPTDELFNSFDRAAKAFTDADWDSFTESINAYASTLASNNLTCSESLQLIEKIKQWGVVSAVKANGAMGADTLTVFFDSEKSDDVAEMINRTGLLFEADESDIADGLKIEMDFGDDNA